MRRLIAAELMAAAVAAAAQQRMDLSWSQLGPALEGKHISLVLPQGVAIQGQVLGVEPESIRIRVTRTENSSACPKGERSIAREQVKLIQVASRGKLWRAILTPGVPAAMMGAMAVAANAVHPTPDPQKVVGIGMGVFAGSLAGGYYAGRALDSRERTEIRVIDDNRQTEEQAHVTR